VLIIGGGLAAIYLASKTANKVNAVKRLEWTNPKITVGRFNLFSGLGLQIKLDIVNNSSEDIAIEYFTGLVRYQGRDLARFTFNANGQNMIIRARTTTPMPFTVKINTLAAFSTITQLVNAIANRTGISPILSIDGSFFAAGLDVPVRFDYDVKQQQLVSTSPLRNNY